jgi:hypothetical protein
MTTLNTVSKAWSQVYEPSNPMFKLAWTQIVNAIQGTWGTGSIDNVTNGSGHWIRSSNIFSFRVNATDSTVITLPFVPKENYLIFAGSSIIQGVAGVNILNINLTTPTTIEAHNIVV